MNLRSGAFETVSGIVLLLAGLGLLGKTGWYVVENYPREEPVNPGRNSPLPGFDTSDDARLREAFEQGRRDALWMRIHLYGIAPTGLMLVLLGTWLAMADYRRRSSRDS